VVTATQTGAAPLTVFAAPSTGSEFNSVGERLVPKGCFKVEDLLFDFDSSFVRPEIGAELPQLAKLRNDNKVGDLLPPLSIFGHADPVGDDDINKRLSGRRAIAMYAMLVRDVDLWEELFSNPAGNDNWGTRAVQTMLSTVQAPIAVDGKGGEETKQAVKSFQTAKGLTPVDGVAGVNTRKALFRAYMDTLCGPQLLLDKKKDFLAQNADGAGLKGDVQGCSEFNPLLMFSKQEAAAFEKSPDKTTRNKENAPNRRVMILLFAPGRRVRPSAWPCPRAKEGVADCKKRFFPDAPTRRSFQTNRREFDDTKDTFACRFYQVLSDDSPCERVRPLPVGFGRFRITVVDEFETPIPAVSVTLVAPNFERTSATDSAGIVQFDGPATGARATVRNDKALSDALAALVKKAPRDLPPPVRPGLVAITPSKTKTSIPVTAGIPQVIMILARTDVHFELPEGWEDLEATPAGPWRLSKTGSRALLELVSQGLGRSVTLRSPPSDEPPFSGTFRLSPQWTPDRKRIMQPGETLESLAENYLGDAAEVDQLVALNPQVAATKSGVTAAQPLAITMPPDAIPGWLSIPQAVQSAVGAILPEAVFATIDVDALHDALFAGDNDAVWNILSALPRTPRSTAKLSGQDLLEIHTQSLLADLRTASDR
jgi:hypothetical protein